jgi:EAL domain-containing protein (putative c-di-GMP-specific phosphodiesterase class I)
MRTPTADGALQVEQAEETQLSPADRLRAVELVSRAAELIRLRASVNDLAALDRFTEALSHDLSDALARQSFRYHYQPIVWASSGVVEGYEATLRWRRGTEDVIPALFLPLADELGSIQAIQQRLLAELPAAFAAIPPTAFISINWSPRQFLRASAASALIDGLRELQLDPRRVIIEITTRTEPIDAELIRLGVELLRDAGVQVALDEFGGRFGAVSYLGQLPIDLVKMDELLLNGVEHSQRAVRILAGVIDFVHHLGLRVVAKGVTTPSQLSTLRRLGCDLVQGHLFGIPARQPVPPSSNM